MSTVKPGQEARLHSAHHGHGATWAVDVGHDGTVHCGERIGWPWLTRVSQGWLSGRGTVNGYATWGMDAKSGAIHGGEAALVGTLHGRRGGIHVLFRCIGIVGGKWGRGSSGSPVHGHGRL